jgi:hypothetical protein
MINKRYKLKIEIECTDTSEARAQMQDRLSNLNFEELFSGQHLDISSRESLCYGDTSENFVFDVNAKVIDELQLPM